ncbi:MAG: PAS-domain containing protein [Xanthobacteraceae bacterium]|nr:PAS-domain containing protein [Xanthobacteraceae bacterium]QYK45078.1 MAG: PAS-domain containing protein [Xanthobacteraceae bacterium]
MPDTAVTGGGKPSANGFWRAAARAASSGAFACILLLSATARSLAAPEFVERLIAFANTLDRREIGSLALTLGILLFAVVTAIMLLRTRARARADHAKARRDIARARAEAERMTALLLSEPQVVVIWDGADHEPTILGSASSLNGGDSLRRILAFGSWLGAEPAAMMDAAVDALRKEGKAFGYALLTPRGRHVEAEGRPIGGIAVLRLRDVTGAKRDHASALEQFKRLQTETEQIRALLDQTPSPVWLRDSEQKISFANRAYAAAVEAKNPADVIERSIELLDQPSRAEVARGRQERGSFRGRMNAVVAGSRRTLEVFETSTGRGAAGIALDVTDAEMARNEIGRVMEAHQRTLNQLATGVAIFGADRRLAFYNAAYVALFRLEPSFLDDRPDDSMVLDKLRAQRCVPETSDFRAFKASLHEAYEAVDARQSLWHLPDGRSLRVAATPNAQGGVTYLFDDISEGVALASRFNTIANTQTETLDALAEAVAVFAGDGRLHLHNSAFRELWRIGADELVEKPHVNVIKQHCRALDMRSAEIWTAIERIITGVAERHRFTRQLEEQGRTLECSVTPLPDGGNLVTFRDISDSVRIERVLRERNAALIAADAIRDTVIRYISHDLRSPLNNISGYTQFLGTPEAGPLTERQREYLGHISSSSAELLAIVDSLQLAIADAGGERVLPREVDVRALLDAIARESGPRLREKRLSLHIDVPAGIGRFGADEDKVRQVLQNLVANAALHSPEGETIGLAAERRQHAMLFHVSDRGPGIPRDVQERLFQNLETLPIDSTHRGAGLGLSLVRSAMKLQGGDVMIDSEPNRGTVVTCVFPLASPEA